MPKLSKYIRSTTDRPTEGVALVYDEKVAPNEILAGPSAATYLKSNVTSDHLVAGGGGGVSRGSGGNRDRLQAAWERRAASYGPRQYRQPDGSISTSRPARNPYAVASRSSWSDLVRFCRQETSGNASAAMLAAQRSRYGVGVSFGEHVAYLKTLGDMSPEIGEDGGFVGYDASRRRPLEDEGHAFNSYFKTESEDVFRREARRRA